jgi:hypothetical protein
VVEERNNCIHQKLTEASIIKLNPFCGIECCLKSRAAGREYFVLKRLFIFIDKLNLLKIDGSPLSFLIEGLMER